MRLVTLLLIFIQLSSTANSQEAAENKIETQIQKGHIQPVSCVAWHPSGDYFASGSEDHSILLWNAKSGKLIRQFNYHTGKILGIHFSKDGTQLLSSAMDNRVIVQEVTTGKLLEEYEYNEVNVYPMSVAFSPNESQIFIGDNRDNFEVVDRESAKRHTLKKGFSAGVKTLSFSPDERYSVDFINYNSLLLIDGVEKDTTTLSFDKPNDYSFTIDGKYLIVGSRKLFLTIFDVETGDSIHTIASEYQCDGCNQKFDLSPDGKLLLMYNGNTGLSIYKTSNWKLVSSFDDLEESYPEVRFSPGGKYVVLSKSNEVVLIDVKTNRRMVTLKNKYFESFNPKISPSDEYILVGDEYFKIKSYDINAKRTNAIYKGYFNQEENIVKELDYNSWYNQSIINHLKLKPSIAISPDEKWIAQGKKDSVITLFNMETGRFDIPLKGHSSQVIALAFHPTKNELASGDAQGYIKIWNLDERKIKREFRGHVRMVFDIAYNSDGTELLSASWDATINHWDLETVKSQPENLGRIDLKNLSAFKIGFSPNDLYLTIGDVVDQTTLYEVDTKKEIKQFIGHSKTISDFLFIENGKKIITASRDGTVKIWDFYSGMLIDKVSSVNNASILSVCYNQSKRQLYFGAADRKIYVYNTIERAITHSFEAHQGGVNYLSLLDGGNTLVSKSTEGDIKFWELKNGTPTELFTYFQLSSKEWLISQPDGYFDGSGEAMKQINYVSGMKSLKVGTFFEKYYQPGLYNQLKNGQRFQEKDQGLNQFMDDVPNFDLRFTNFQGKSAIVETDSTYQHNKAEVELNMAFSSGMKSVENVLIYNNGKLIKEEKLNEDVVFRGLSNEKKITIPLYPKKNKISVRVQTTKGLSTEEQTIDFFYDTLSGKTELFILSLGINKYENSRYNLNYAGNDAEAFSASIEKGANSLFHKVYDYSLKDKKVTKANVLSMIEEINQKMGPEDVFIFFYAGHGVMLQNEGSSNFYLVMSDITNLYGEQSMMEEKGISARDILDISKSLSAQKQVFVLDACQSGAAIKELAIRGVEREKTLAQLARSSGTFFITASQDIEYANEVGNLKHGIFTYAILELLAGNSEKAVKDETISIYELKSYVEARVPELSKQYQGSPQYPTGYSFGNDFPIGVVGGE
ncbi:MAG: caspase family protein [Brumimicrobium sp.]